MFTISKDRARELIRNRKNVFADYQRLNVAPDFSTGGYIVTEYTGNYDLNTHQKWIWEVTPDEQVRVLEKYEKKGSRWVRV